MSKAKKNEFRPDDYVVYPAHGVGQIISIEKQEIAGMELELFVIKFEKDKMTLRVPTNKAVGSQMRLVERSAKNADVLITAVNPDSGWHDYTNFAEYIELGRRATEAALPELKALVETEIEVEAAGNDNDKNRNHEPEVILCT